ncbi:MAG: hypothetical protein FJ271_14880 [Planctomycetes bacterium]|nr:hypothetical protein [Planctomycetota bacterium]
MRARLAGTERGRSVGRLSLGARIGSALVLLGMLIVAGGCLTQEPSRATSLKPRPDQGLGGNANIVQIDAALLERPIGDLFLNHDLWNHTDEQVIDPDCKGMLDCNGFRVGKMIGSAPARLQTMLTSERSCINPRRRLLPSGRSADQVLGLKMEQTQFTLQRSGQTEEVSLEQAQFLLEVTPTVADGRITLRIVPKVQHGETLPDWHPAADGSDWTFQMNRPSKIYQELACEIKLSPNVFLVIGADFDQPDSLGYRAFVQDQGETPVQRLLVMRVNCGVAGDADSFALAAHMSGQGPLPLALQAPLSAVRANSP